MTQKTTKAVCLVAVVLFMLLTALLKDVLSALSYSVSAAALLYAIYDRWLWKINPFEKTPKLFGNYDATFVSNFNGKTIHLSKIRIKQTLSTISIYEECDDGYSESVVASLFKFKTDGEWHLYYIYRTHPNAGFGRFDDSHEGTALLHIKPDCQGNIEGTYFTNRINQTAGNLILKKQ